MKIQETLSLQCPYCGEIMEIQIDCMEGNQELTEECSLCFQPVTVAVMFSDNGVSSVDILS